MGIYFVQIIRIYTNGCVSDKNTNSHAVITSFADFNFCNFQSCRENNRNAKWYSVEIIILILGQGLKNSRRKYDAIMKKATIAEISLRFLHLNVGHVFHIINLFSKMLYKNFVKCGLTSYPENFNVNSTAFLWSSGQLETFQTFCHAVKHVDTCM